jgi:phage tail-like protein
MSCGPQARTFRLLDGYFGWEAVDSKGLEGLEEGGAVRLARLAPGTIGEEELLQWLPPPWLTRGCGPCEWYLAAWCKQYGQLLHLLCSESWEAVDGSAGRPGFLSSDRSQVSARGHELALGDPAAGRAWLLGRSGEQVLAALDIQGLQALVLTPTRELLVAVAAEERLRRYDLAGVLAGTVEAALPHGEVSQLAVSDDCTIWVVVKAAGGLQLFRAARDARSFEPATLESLGNAFPKSGVSAAGSDWFCLTALGKSGLPETRCYDRCGRPLEHPPAVERAPRYVKQGQLLTGPISSGQSRCRWHRVRIDAEVPSGTHCWAEVGTSEDPAPPDQGKPDPGWPGFPVGPLHPEDWQVTHPGDPLDFLIQQPPGQYLFLRLRLLGDGFATPAVRRIRIDLTRSTSLERLPSVYRETPEAEDFGERFLSLFDATIEQIDQAILRAPALLDGEGIPDEVLPWLGAFLDLAFDPAWSPAQRRQLIRAAPRLYPIRGTRAALIETIQIITGATPAIIELALSRSWGILSQDARVGEMRLFGRSSARFRIGSSQVGGAPLKSFGNPDQDPTAVEAFRFQVLFPLTALGTAPNARERLAQLVASIKPAHTVASLRVGGMGFVLGVTSAVGVDTVLGGLPPPLLGTMRLSRQSAVAAGRKGRRVGFPVGASAVGIQTRIE